MNAHLPPLVEKALVDAGYDLISDADKEWTAARVSGTSAEVWVRAFPEGTVLAVPPPGVAERIGLLPIGDPPRGMESAGLAAQPDELFRALRLLRTLITHPVPKLSAEVEARLEKIPATERTREVRERIGQDVFRDALIEFWGGRCALSGRTLPSALLRASHAKPWAESTDSERLDPFNGLLLAVQYDALFDKGLIAFGDEGQLLLSAELTDETKQFVGLAEPLRLRFVLPGHVGYLRYHREHVAKLP